MRARSGPGNCSGSLTGAAGRPRLPTASFNLGEYGLPRHPSTYKGKEAKLVFMAHALMENRNGLLVDFLVSDATGTAERDAVPVLLDEARERGFHPQTLGADKGYDTRGCVGAMRARGVAPHVAQHTSGRSSAIDGRTTRHRGYALSQRLRKRVEEICGWMKTVGGFRRTRYRGLDRTGLAGYPVGTAYNLVRMARLTTAETPAPQAAQAP